MNKLLEFLRRSKHWFVFLLLEVIALSMVFSNTLYSRSVSWYATNALLGRVNELMTEFWDYIDLRPENKTLLAENARLRQANIHLMRQMQELQAYRELPRLRVTDSVSLGEGSYVVARVLNRTSRIGEVFFTIDKGEADGFRKDMGVMSATGVVGAVYSTSRHYALVIPILNQNMRLSCSLSSQGVSGTLLAPVNPNSNEAVLSNVPPHAHPRRGDTIVTSGYSYLFPEGMMVGTVADSVPSSVKGSAGVFANFPVRLATDFQSLRYVYILLEKPVEEARALEDSVRHDE